MMGIKLPVSDNTHYKLHSQFHSPGTEQTTSYQHSLPYPRLSFCSGMGNLERNLPNQDRPFFPLSLPATVQTLELTVPSFAEPFPWDFRVLNLLLCRAPRDSGCGGSPAGNRCPADSLLSTPSRCTGCLIYHKLAAEKETSPSRERGMSYSEMDHVCWVFWIRRGEAYRAAKRKGRIKGIALHCIASHRSSTKGVPEPIVPRTMVPCISRIFHIDPGKTKKKVKDRQEKSKRPERPLPCLCPFSSSRFFPL